MWVFLERVFSSLVKISFAQIYEAFFSWDISCDTFFYADKIAQDKTDEIRAFSTYDFMTEDKTDE